MASDKALEQLAKAKEAWAENEIKQKDRIAQLQQQLSDANHDINTTNQALDELCKVQTVRYSGVTYSQEPQLGDFYEPSDEMEKYSKIFVTGVGIVGEL